MSFFGMMLCALAIGAVPSETFSYEKPQEAVIIVEATSTKKIEWTFETLVPHLAEKYKQDESLARRIIHCESWDMPVNPHPNYTKEGVLWSMDIGYWQINDYYNRRAAKAQGFDIDIWQENLEWGFIMLKHQGTKPWSASQPCWGGVQ